MRTSSPAMQRAMAFLRNLIDEKRQAGEWLLPTAAECARLAGTARFTMWKALDRFRKAGVLMLTPGRGIELTGSPSPVTADRAPAPPHPYRRWESVLRDLESDILSHALTPDSLLPSLKELQQTYGCSYQTIRKVMATLDGKGFVHRESGGFRPAVLHRPASQSCICMIARAHANGTLVHWSAEQSFRAFESRCARANIRLITIPCFFDHATPVSFLERPGLIRDYTHDRPILGYALWTGGLERRFKVPDMVRALKATKKPVALINDSGNRDDIVRHNAHRSGLCRQFVTNSSFDSGHDVGNYLLRTGHRTVAVVYPDNPHQAGWVGERIDGLRQAFVDAGCDKLPTAYPITALGDDRNPAEAVDDVRVVIDGKHYRLRRNKDVNHLHLRGYAKALHAAFASSAIRRQLEPLLASITGTKAPNAIVGVSDMIALECLDLIRRNFRNRTVTVIGFDDTRAAMQVGMTSYNHNLENLVEHVLSFCLSPRTYNSARIARDMVTKIPGFIVDREPRP